MPTVLRQSQRNALFLTIKGAGANPLEFEWSEIDGAWTGYVDSSADAILHPPSGSVFGVSLQPDDDFGVYFQPGKDSLTGTEFSVSWAEVLIEASKWVHRIGEDRGPDLWELAAQERKQLSSPPGLSNAPFTPDERERVFAALDVLKTEMLNAREVAELSVEQVALLGAAIEDLKEATRRVGPKDWVLLLYGTLFNLAVQAAFAPDQARHLLQMAGHALQAILPGLPMLPPP